MLESMNVPYVKKYDENGRVTNPIKGSLISEFPNRKERREELQKHRFYGESKNLHLTVKGAFKYLRLKQIEFTKQGQKKVIEHYLPC